MGFLYSQFFRTPPYPTGNYEGKTIVITGSNTGLGKEAARHYIRLGASRMILAVRNLDSGHEAKHDIEATTKCASNAIEVWKLDMGSYASVQKFAARVNSDLDRVDIFIANAGCAKAAYSVTEDNETQITINVVSTFLLAFLVLPKLKETAARYKIRPNLCITGSGAYQHTTFPQRTAPEGELFATMNDKETAEKNWDGQYPLSKLLQIFIVRSFAEKYPALKFPVTVNNASPGLCHSGLGREFGGLGFFLLKLAVARSTEVGSRTVFHGGTAGIETHGKFLEDCLIEEPTEMVTGNKEVQDRLWFELVDRLKKIRPDIMNF